MLASALGSSIIVARWLGAEGVGALAVISVTVALAVQLGCAGLPSANTYFIAQDRSKLPSVWSNALLFGLIAGSIIAAGLIVVARLRPALLGQVSVSLITVAALSIPFQLVTLLGQNVFLGTGQIDRFNVMDAVAQLLLLLNAIVALALLGTGLYVLVSLNTAIATLVCVTVAVMVSRTVRRTGEKVARPDAKVFRRMIRYGIKFHIAVIAATLTLRADLLIVNHFWGAKEAGVYALAAQMGSLLMLLPAIIGTLLFPRVASEPDSQGGLTMKATRHTAFIMLFACLAAVPLSFALPLVYGAAFRDSTIQLLILLPGIYLLGIESVMVQHFNGLGLPVAIPTFWIIALVCNLAFNLILIPVFGATGAAAVSTFTYALIFALVAGYFRLKTGNNLSTALLLRGDEFRELISPNRLGFFLR
jgi:O-antigen/teichoic acid export membrane protein